MNHTIHGSRSQRTTLVFDTPHDPPPFAVDAALATVRALFHGDIERASALAGLGAHIVARETRRGVTLYGSH